MPTSSYFFGKCWLIWLWFNTFRIRISKKKKTIKLLQHRNIKLNIKRYVYQIHFLFWNLYKLGQIISNLRENSTRVASTPLGKTDFHITFPQRYRRHTVRLQHKKTKSTESDTSRWYRKSKCCKLECCLADEPFHGFHCLWLRVWVILKDLFVKTFWILYLMLRIK